MVIQIKSFLVYKKIFTCGVKEFRALNKNYLNVSIAYYLRKILLFIKNRNKRQKNI